MLLSLERGGELGGAETSIGCLPWMPPPEIESPGFWSMGWYSKHLSYTSQGCFLFLMLYVSVLDICLVVVTIWFMGGKKSLIVQQFFFLWLHFISIYLCKISPSPIPFYVSVVTDYLLLCCVSIAHCSTYLSCYF